MGQKSAERIEPISLQIDSPYLRGDEELSAYLRNVSVPVLTKLRKNGLPCHKVNTIYLYDKEEVRKWVNSYFDLVNLIAPQIFEARPAPVVSIPNAQTEKRVIEGTVQPRVRIKKAM